MGIVFFGSGPVAKKSLELLGKNFLIEAVITKPSTKQLMSQAVPASTTIFCVNNRQELDELIDNQGLKSAVAVLIDFGIIVSQKVISKFGLGIVNSHFSRLPQWRGADPITFALLSGQPSTGVSLMMIDKGMDTGKILVQKSIPINPNDNSDSLTDKLIILSDQLLTTYLPKYTNGHIKPRSQPHPDRATYSKKLTKEDGLIDWSKSADQIEREIRAYQTWPKSYTRLKNIDLIIKSATIINQQGTPGDYYHDKGKLIIYCGQNALSVQSLQPAGKKAMPIKAFLAGYKL